jgi:hypothetical protein
LASAESQKDSGLPKLWTAFTAIGSFFLYFLGYLVLRFQLSSLGIDSDLGIIDERYLFAGARFLVYFFATIPICLLLVSPIVGCNVLLKGKLFPAISRWFKRPDYLLSAGIAFAVVFVQFIERQCLPLNGLLLLDTLPPPEWLQRVLLDQTGAIGSIYFSGLLLATAICVFLWLRAWFHRAVASKLMLWLLALMCIISFLLLPVNYGIVIANKDFARVSTLDGKEPLKAGETAWRIWEGKDTVTFLVKSAASRRLVAIDKKEIRRTEIVGYDFVLLTLFGGGPK